MSAFLCLASLLLLGNGYASGEAVVAFDGAAASSTYAGKEFAAQEAMSKGSGYWCRYRDTHRFACVGAVRSTVMCVQCWKPCPWPDCSLDGYACRTAEGRWCDPELVRCSCLRAVVLQDRCRQCFMCACRAYGPGEYKVLTSADGGNFQEATCWRDAKRTEASYRETLMFEGTRSAKALTVVMRSPMPWGYFALNDVALLVEPGPMMLISGSSSEAGERCVVSRSGSIGSEGCLQAMAGGAGREIFTWSEESQIVSTVEGKCISLASGAAASGSPLTLQDCAAASEAGDGRSNFEVTAAGQLKFKHMENYCVVALRDGLRMQDCSAAEEGSVAQDKFFFAAVAEFDPTPATAASDVATLLQAAAARQETLMAALHVAMPRLDACRLALSTNSSRVRQALTLGRLNSSRLTFEKREAAEKAIAEMYSSLGVDMAGIKTLIADTAAALALASSKSK